MASCGPTFCSLLPHLDSEFSLRSDFEFAVQLGYSMPHLKIALTPCLGHSLSLVSSQEPKIVLSLVALARLSFCFWVETLLQLP